MNKILILFAHPALEKSRVQYRLAKAANSVDGIHLHDLYEHYPDFMINVAREQNLLREHDIILLQHPFYWYSSPAILKEWQDLVLEFGFAYGVEKSELHGKIMANIISAGGSKETYRHDGHNHFSMNDFLRPFEQTAILCGMRYLPPFTIHGTHEMSEARIDRYARQYRQLLRRLQQQVPKSSDSGPLNALNEWEEDPD